MLPSGIWRVPGAVAHVPLDEHTDTPPPGHGPVLVTGWWYPVKVWPRWLPWLGGRPLLAAVTIHYHRRRTRAPRQPAATLVTNSVV